MVNCETMERLLSHRVAASRNRTCREGTDGMPLPGELAVGAGNFGGEGAQFAGVILAGLGFDATGDINSERANGEDRFRDVFRGQATGEDDRIFCRGPLCNFPVGQLPRTSIGSRLLFAETGVEEKSGRVAVSTKWCERKLWPGAKGFDDRNVTRARRG